MGQRPNHVVTKGAQIKLKKEECVSNMERRLNDAAAMDVQIMPTKEECV